MSKINLTDKALVQCEGFVASDMDGETVMMHIQSGKYYNLGEVGGKIWSMMQSPVALEEIVQRLMEEYEIEQDTCRQQVSTFLVRLHGEGLIQTTERNESLL